jgi:hypothetical protein
MSLQLTRKHEKTEDEDEGKSEDEDEGCRRDRTPDRA